MFTFPVAHFSASAGGYAVDNSALFNDDDTEYLTWTPSGSATNRKKFTMSAWVKRGNLGTNFPIFSARTGINSDDALNFTSGDKLELMIDYTNDGQLTSNVLFRDPHAWFHVVCAINTTLASSSSRVKLYVNNVQITSFATENYPAQDYEFERWQVSGNENTIGRTLSVAAGKADGYMAEVVWIDGQQLTPSSFGETDDNGVWRPISIANAGLTFGNNGFYLPFTNSAGLGQDYSGSTAESKVQENTYAAGSEVNKTDMTNAGFTAGAKFTAVASAALPTVKIRASSTGFSSVTVRIETDGGSGNAPSGTLVDSNAEVTGITSSGAGLKTADFPNGGPVLTAGTLYWIVLANAGNWGWQHDVSGSGGALGIRDASGYQAGRGLGHEVYQLGNIFTPVNSPTQTIDSPTSNFAVSSPLQLGSGATLSEGNLKVTHDNNCISQCSMPIPSSGKYYFEVSIVTVNTTQPQNIGLMPIITGASNTNHAHVNAGSQPLQGVFVRVADGKKCIDSNMATGATYGSQVAQGSILQVAVDADNGTIWFGDDNTWMNSATASEIAAGTTTNSAETGRDYSVPHFPTFFNTSSNTPVIKYNFGQTAFAHTPPTGYVALNAANAFSRSAPAIGDGTAHFRASAFEGNALASRDIIQSTRAQANLETGNNETNNGDMSGTAAGIKFVCTRTGKCPSIHIRTSSTGMSGVTCQIKQDGGTGQSPSGSVLTNGEKTGVSFSGQGYAIFDFPNGGPELTAGTTYWFMIPSDTGTWGIARDNDNSEGGPGGRISSSDGSYNTGSFGHKIFQVFGSQFQPDLVWGKNRNLGTHGHRWFDAVRGATKVLQSSAPDQEATDANGLTAFNSNGFEIGNGDHLNGNGNGIIAWQWLAGNSTSSNTQGRKASDSSVITSTVSVNQTAGFSIVSWQGNGENSTIGHGLNAIPKWIIIKNRSSSQNWPVYFEDIGNDKSLLLDTTGSEAAGMFQNTTPTPTVFSVDGSNNVNKSGENMIAYCWAEISGFSKFGSYIGSGAEPNFIDLGFTPAWVMNKKINTTGTWIIRDNARNLFNERNKILEANAVASETTDYAMDFISNGFVWRDTQHYTNQAPQSGTDQRYIYAAFASSPFAGKTAATAR
nr:hypothetical protein [uncultured Mediterranean phage uvMED]